MGKRLGRGAFGEVFEGQTADSPNSVWKKVAIKRIRGKSCCSLSHFIVIVDVVQCIDSNGLLIYFFKFTNEN